MTISCLLAAYQQTHEHDDAQKWWIVMAEPQTEPANEPRTSLQESRTLPISA